MNVLSRPIGPDWEAYWDPVEIKRVLDHYLRIKNLKQNSFNREMAQDGGQIDERRT